MKIERLLEELKRRCSEAIAHVELLPAKSPSYAELSKSLPEPLEGHLRGQGLKLYTHQAEMIELVRAGANVLLATPTASGKTLAFNLSVFEGLYSDPEATALYIYPLKALTQDQLQTIHKLEAETGIPVQAAVYDGDTPESLRPTIRERSRIILTNPYALHQYLPWHHKWRRFFANLKFVVLDEVHAYRGVFGSNVALLMRRLRRIVEHYGARPQFILSSATLANPEEHSRKLVGLDFEVITESGAPQGEKHFIFWDSTADSNNSVHRQTSELLAEHVQAGLQTICFTISRKLAELVALWAQELATSGGISAYRAGYQPHERREIEQKLKTGELRGVASTTALELGIDIGGLDSVIISGYPGTVLTTWQMAGRAGRGREASLVTLIGFENPLDQYFMRHPERFFARSHEHAVIDLENPHILLGHVMCAAAELPIRPERDERYFCELEDALGSLEREKLVQRTPAGWVYRGLARPIEVVQLDHISERAISVLDEEGKLLETLELRRAYEEAHPGAVLLHRGETYLIRDLDLEAGVAHAERKDVEYYTDALRTVDLRIHREIAERKTEWGSLALGEVQVVERFSRYRVRRYDRTLGMHDLGLPPLEFETVALWFTLSEELERELREKGLDWAGGLHAAEHALIAMTPYHAMCDRWDIGGFSTPLHPDTKSATITIYDGHPGGIGIAEKVYQLFGDLVHTTYELIRDCECEDGCPSCIYSPKCGDNNEPLDKRAALMILDGLLP
jgi:DEAD/DEAH box helicase domain-containing protein